MKPMNEGLVTRDSGGSNRFLDIDGGITGTLAKILLQSLSKLAKPAYKLLRRQPPNNNPQAYIERTWIKFDSLVPTIKLHLSSQTMPLLGRYNIQQLGLRIFSKFTCFNSTNDFLEISAYFYFDNGQKLIDWNNAYNATDGQVSVGTSINPPFRETCYHDFMLFIPYYELHLAPGQHSLYYTISIFHNSQQIAYSNRVYFHVNIY